MATSNSGTVDIAVYTTLDKDGNKNILSFIVQDEYHLKKLAVGAYSLNILDTQLLNDLSERNCSTISCGNFVICHNFTEEKTKALNAILFNTKPTVLKKGVCIFKIVYSVSTVANNAAVCCFNNKTTHGRQPADACQFNEIDSTQNAQIACKRSDENNKLANHNYSGVGEAPQEIVIKNQTESAALSERHDSLFLKTFGSVDADDDSDNSSLESNNHDDTDTDEEVNDVVVDDANHGIQADELLPPFKRQKLDDAQ
ncbi:AC82-like protein [Orgyia pseudotsugata single capsid nuclopolyhedrovirus]|nr:AC82-like protein [Orgyia pseudotsugata single capsid nuclopolyhedrovirus]